MDGVPALQTNSNRSLLAYRKWLADTGVSKTTGWRWIKSGWIRTINIAGRLYVTREEIESFEVRAGNGEFAKPATGAAARPAAAIKGTFGSDSLKAGSIE